MNLLSGSVTSPDLALDVGRRQAAHAHQRGLGDLAEELLDLDLNGAARTVVHRAASVIRGASEVLRGVYIGILRNVTRGDATLIGKDGRNVVGVANAMQLRVGGIAMGQGTQGNVGEVGYEFVRDVV